ncbi:hypothetical protein ACRJ4W_15375 [Streptomyces sp. GLT-R25]
MTVAALRRLLDEIDMQGGPDAARQWHLCLDDNPRRGTAGQTEPTPPPSADLRAAIAELLWAGATYGEVRERLGVGSYTTIAQVRQAEGIPVVQRPRSSRSAEETYALYAEPYGDGHARWAGPWAGRMPADPAPGPGRQRPEGERAPRRLPRGVRPRTSRQRPGWLPGARLRRSQPHDRPRHAQRPGPPPRRMSRLAARSRVAGGRPVRVHHVHQEKTMTGPTTALALLRDTENYLSALHGSVARHDHLAANLACAGCELRDRIAAALPELTAEQPHTDRTAVLREAYEIAYAEGMRLNALEAEIGVGPYRGALAVAHLLRKAISGAQQPRRMADETAATELLALATVLEIPRPGTALPLQLRRSYGHADRWAICDREGRRWDRDLSCWVYEAEGIRDEALRDATRYTLAEAVPLARELAAGARQDEPDHVCNSVQAHGEMDEPLGYLICGLCGKPKGGA